MNLHKVFEEYTYSKGIIYSHLEGQYPYELIREEEYVILMTAFDYHFVGGKVPKNMALFLQEIIAYIKKHDKDEFVLFAPNKSWREFLEQVIEKLGGVKDARFVYQLDPSNFSKKKIEECIIEEVKEEVCKERLLQANIKKEGKVVSKATALMTGHSHVEIDVFTEEAYRRRGYAYKVASALINEILHRGLVPDWSCWRVKESSQALAKKLGYDFKEEVPVYVWVEDLRSKDLL